MEVATDRQTALWRALLLVLLGLALVILIGDLRYLGSGGSFGVKPAFASADRFTVDKLPFAVKALEPGTSAAAQLRPGDLVRLADPSPRTYLAVLRAAPGSTIEVLVRRGSQRFRARLVAAPDPTEVAPWTYVFELGRLAMIAVGILATLRAPDRPEARALALMGIGFGFGTGYGYPWLPDPIALGVFAMRPLGLLLALCATVLLAARVPAKPDPPFRQALRRIAWGTFAIAALLFGSRAYVLWGHARPPGLSLAAPISIAIFVVDLLSIVAALWLSYRLARGAERARVGWVVATLAVGSSGLVPFFIVSLLAGKNGPPPWSQAFGLTLVAWPLGFAYAILRHRLVDLGFVINRALVFAGVSGTIVVTIAVAEWAIGKYLISASHLTSVSLSLAIALALGFFLRRIQAVIDRVVDRVFFHERHAAEQSLQNFASEAAFVSDPEVLLERAQLLVQNALGVSQTAIVLREPSGAFEAVRSSFEGWPGGLVDRDDPAAVRMRSTHEPVGLEELSDGTGLRSALPGVLVIPLVVRGELAGAWCIGARPQGEAIAPDVLAALERAASAFGNAYDGLGIEALKRDVRALLGGAGNLEDLRGRLDSADPFHFARPVGGAGSAARATTARPSAVPVSGEARESFGPVVAKESA